MSQIELDEIEGRMKPFLEKQYTEKGLDLANQVFVDFV